MKGNFISVIFGVPKEGCTSTQTLHANINAEGKTLDSSKYRLVYVLQNARKSWGETVVF